MTTFEEIDKLELDAADLDTLKKLGQNPDFAQFCHIVEYDIQKKIRALATGTFAEGVSLEEYLKGVRGFARNWERLKRLTQKNEL